MKRNVRITVLLPALFVLSLSAAELGPDDKNFIRNAAEGSNGKIALAQLAIDKTTRSDVKALANRINTDHQKANEQLKSIAEANHIEMPGGLGPTYEAEKIRLDALTGAQFDAEYVKAMVREHKADLAVFDREVQFGFDADLKKFASMTIPILRQHLSMARTIQQMKTPQ